MRSLAIASFAWTACAATSRAGLKMGAPPSMPAKFRYKAGSQGALKGRIGLEIMSDDSFIREVNEEIRQDQARALWDRFGPAFIGVAVAVVLATAAYVAWDYWTESRANASGDAFSQALKLANEGKDDEALAALKALEADSYGAYPLLARMRAATVLVDKGDFAGAVAEFDAVAADSSIPDAIRDMARLRAGLILVDSGSYEDVSSRVEVLSTDDQRAAPLGARGARRSRPGRPAGPPTR